MWLCGFNMLGLHTLDSDKLTRGHNITSSKRLAVLLQTLNFIILSADLKGVGIVTCRLSAHSHSPCLGSAA
jgi:hypothetical protein